MKRTLLCAILAIAGSSAMASPYSWVNWTSSDPGNQVAQGTISTSNGNVGVTFTGPYDHYDQNFPSWTPASTYADGSIIDNAPTSVNGLIHLSKTGSFSLTFDRQVNDLALAVWSLGQPGLPVTYTFDHNLVFISGGPGAEFGGQSITTTANSLSGSEGNGTVLFHGPFTSLNWTIDNPESYHGFTIGLQTAQAVPEPASMAALAMGGVALLRRRKANKA